MSELPYVVVSLAEVGHKMTFTTHTQAHANDAENIYPLCLHITDVTSKVNIVQFLCLFPELNVCLGMCKTDKENKADESEGVIVPTQTNVHSLFRTVRNIAQTKAILQCVGVCVCSLHKHILTQTQTHSIMLWVWPVSQGAMPHDYEARQPQTFTQSKSWIALKCWSHLKCDTGCTEFNRTAADFLISISSLVW